MNPPTFGLIVIGDEILSGKRSDAHLPKFIGLLAERGLALGWADYLGDEPARITASLRRAFASGDVVFCTGGIGATPDDHTRACAAAALGLPLQPHPEAQALIAQRTREQAEQQGLPYQPHAPDNQQRLQMGVFPQGAQIVPNPYNRIPGFYCDAPAPGGRIYFFPGFPVMAWPMAEWALDTHHALHFRRGAWLEKSAVLPGAIESVLTPLMQRIEHEHPGVKVFSLPSVDHPEWGRCVELGVKGSAAECETAWLALRAGVVQLGQPIGTELVRRL